MKNSTIITLKLIGASSLICLIAFLFMVVSPDEKETLIKTAEADIYMLDGIEDTERFKKAVSAMGIKGRPYDFNGNVMFFGNARIHDSASAEETANLVQQQLVFSGVNKKNYLKYDTQLTTDEQPNAELTEEEAQKAQDYRDAMIAGEVVPTRKTKTLYEMSGVTGIESTKAFAEKTARLSEEEAKGKSLANFINGYRYIEVRQEEGSSTAEILAVWTDDKFDGDKLTNKEGVQQSPPDDKIPACIGCERVRRVQALDKNEPYNINKWVTTSSIDETYDFYLKSMSNRGWKESGKQQKIGKLARALPEVAGIIGRGLSLEKDGEVIEITILPSKKGGAEVFSMEKYMDTQPTLNRLPVEPNSLARDTVNRILGN